MSEKHLGMNGAEAHKAAFEARVRRAENVDDIVGILKELELNAAAGELGNTILLFNAYLKQIASAEIVPNNPDTNAVIARITALLPEEYGIKKKVMELFQQTFDVGAAKNK
ncbi:MAG: hypothetical protein ACI9VM_000676 [Candidatus Azotimanducaceae bacterium]|jgi:hypothetical protein